MNHTFLMNKFVLLLVALACASFVQAQKISDTAQKNIPESWKHFFPGVRLAIGLQKSFYYEAGLSFQRYTYHERRGFAATCFYLAYERTSASGDHPVNGFKIGIEGVVNGGTNGIEIRYLYNSLDSADVIITPKVGVGLGAATFFYGYNFSTNKRPFANLGRHQFSLAINTNILFYHLKHNE
jgi:hypothetical protein